MSSNFWYYDWEYWNLYHKVTFDGIRKLILVNEGVIALNWKEDVYSAWKEWVQLQNHQDNMGYQQAMRSTGGDYITSDGSRRVGGTFFLMNGWRLQTWSGHHRLSIDGNVYTEEGDPIYIPHTGNFGVVIEQTLSSLVETVTATAGGSEPGSIPTVNQIVDGVWDRLSVDNVATGTFGAMMSMIKATGDLNFDKLVEANAKIDTATDLVQTLLKYEKNRTKIDQTAKTLTVFDDDGVTPLKVFDLKDFTGAGSITTVAEKVPV